MELQSIFTTVCNMTVTGSVVIGCVLLARLALRRAPRVFSWALWLVVLFRLLCPVSISAPVSVLEIVDAPEPRSNVGAVEYIPVPEADTNAVAVIPGQTGTPHQIVTKPMAKTPDWQLYGSVIWVVGLAGLLGYGVISYGTLKKKMRASMALEWGIRESDRIEIPFVLGFLRPVIYLPVTLEAREREHIVLHERCHVRWGDPLVKGLFYLACCLHWFNPLVWLAFILCGRDMEMRCDEAVLRELGPQVRSDYAQSLLNLAAGRHYAPAPLAFGEGDTGKRVRHVLSWKRRAAWVAIPAAVLCALVLVITAVNPDGRQDTPFGHSYRAVTVTTVPSDPREAPALPHWYTLTSDTLLFSEKDQGLEMHGALKEVPSGTPRPVTMPEGALNQPSRKRWKTEDDAWWLFQMEDGSLHLWQEGAYLVKLERIDLLGVSIKQPGIESYVEPVWYRSGEWEWLPDAMSTTLVNEGAQMVLMPELDVDRILVSEEYYQRMANGEYDITTTDYFLEPDRNGDFLLEISRRGTVHDDFAVYRVTVGEENYIFQLGFPVVPNETSFSVNVEEQTHNVSFSEGNAWITLQLPESWEYAVTSLADDNYAAGITFWPRGREEGKLRFEYYPGGFGVCGTGLESTTMTLAGQTVGVGTYDNESLWTFLSFGEKFAVWGEGHERWWAEYGDAAMEILDSARFGEYVDAGAVRNYFRDFRLHDLGPGQILLGERDYQTVYYSQRSEIRLYQYRAAGGDVDILNEWSGRVWDDVCVSINCLELDGEYVYFGYLRNHQDGQRLEGGSLRFLTQSGGSVDMPLDEFRGFCFVSQVPLADFEVRTADGTLVLDLAGYLERGCQIGEAEGKIVLDDLGEVKCAWPFDPAQ